MTSHELMTIVAGWAIPLILAWLVSNIHFVTARPPLLAAIVAAAVSVGVTITLVQLFSPLRATIALAPEGGACPPGYIDKSTIILIRWRNAPEFYQTPSDIPTRGVYSGNPDWVNDHAKLCVHE